MKFVNFKSFIAYWSSFFVVCLVTFNGFALDTSGFSKVWLSIQEFVSFTGFSVFLGFRYYRQVYKRVFESILGKAPESYTLGEESIVLKCQAIRGSFIMKLVFKVFFKNCVFVLVNLREGKTIIEQRKVRCLFNEQKYEDNEEL